MKDPTTYEMIVSVTRELLAEAIAPLHEKLESDITSLRTTFKENTDKIVESLDEKLKKKFEEEFVYEIDKDELKGEDGKPSTIPGPAGRDSSIPGPIGKQGPPGKDGKTPTKEELRSIIAPLIPPPSRNGKDGRDGANGSPDSPTDIIDKLKSLSIKEWGKGWIPAAVLKDLIFINQMGGFSGGSDSQGTSISFGSDNEIPYTNVLGDGFDYSALFKLIGNSLQLGTPGAALGTYASRLQVDGTGTMAVIFMGPNEFNPGFVFNGSNGNTHMYTFDGGNFQVNASGETRITGSRLVLQSGAVMSGNQQAFNMTHEYASIGVGTLVLDSDTSGGPNPVAATYKVIQGKFLGTEKFYLNGLGELVLVGGCEASTYSVGGVAGASGSFTTADLKTVSVVNGIITSIV